jgi:hypothetical protein
MTVSVISSFSTHVSARQLPKVQQSTGEVISLCAIRQRVSVKKTTLLKNNSSKLNPVDPRSLSFEVIARRLWGSTYKSNL